jgi:tektin-3
VTSSCMTSSRRNALYSRYTPSTWDASNRANYDLSERERGLAEKLRSDAWQVIQSTDQRTRVRQQSNTKKLRK